MTQNNSSVTQYLLNKYGKNQGQGGYNPQTGASYIPANVQQAQQSQVAQYLVNKYAGERKTWTQRQQETRAWEEEKKRQEEQRRLQEARERQKQSQPIAQNRLGQSMSQNLMNTPYAKLQNQAVGYNPTTQRNQPVATSKTGQPLTNTQLQAQSKSPYFNTQQNYQQMAVNQRNERLANAPDMAQRQQMYLKEGADTANAERILANPNANEEKKRLAQQVIDLDNKINQGKKPNLSTYFSHLPIANQFVDMFVNLKENNNPGSTQSQLAKIKRYYSNDEDLRNLQAEYDALTQKQQANSRGYITDTIMGVIGNYGYSTEFGMSKLPRTLEKAVKGKGVKPSATSIAAPALYILTAAVDDINKRNLDLVGYNPETNSYYPKTNNIKQAYERITDKSELAKDLGTELAKEAVDYLVEDYLEKVIGVFTKWVPSKVAKIPQVQKGINAMVQSSTGKYLLDILHSREGKSIQNFFKFASVNGKLTEQGEEEVQSITDNYADQIINEEELHFQPMSGKERIQSIVQIALMQDLPIIGAGIINTTRRNRQVTETTKTLTEAGYTTTEAKSIAEETVNAKMQAERKLIEEQNAREEKEELEGYDNFFAKVGKLFSLKNQEQQLAQEQQPIQEQAQQPVQEQEIQISESVADLSPESEDVVSITDNNGQVLQIQRNQELNPQAQNVEQDFINQLQNLEDKVVEYEQRFGNEINTDNARYLLDKYADKAFRQEHTYETQRPASAFSTYLYERKLNELKNLGKEGVVVFTAGGTGAGKSTALTHIGADLNNADLVFDSNLSNIEAALKKINQALEAGQKVEIDYIHSDIIKAWERALARAEEEGRTLPISEHIRQHNGALQTIQQLEKEFANNEDVTFRIIDNTGENGTQKVIGLDKLPSQLYNIADLERRLEQITKELYDKGSISKSNYQSSVRKTQAQRSARRYDSEFNDSKSQKSSSRSSKQKESQSVNSDNKSPQSVQNEDNVSPSQKDKETPQTPQNEPVKQEIKPQTKEDKAATERLKSLDKNANEVYNRVLQSLQEGNKKVTKAAKMNAALTAGYAQKWAERMNQIEGGESYTALDFLERLNIEANAKEAAKVDAQNQVFNQEVKKQAEDIKKEFEGTDKWLKAPNGKDTNLTEDQWLAVRTDAFKKWFGDWENDKENASKIIDENGEPKVVYHVTGADFDTFDITKARQNMDIPAFFFSSGTEDWQDMGENVIPAFLNIRNPVEKPMAKGNGAEVVEKLKEQGYDGTTLEEEEMETEYAAFEPTQVKSVDNRGTFSSEDANIYNQAAANQLKGQVIIDQARRTIKLFEAADQSTFAHELGHIALTDLKEMASMEGASTEIKNDWKTVSSWLDIKQDQANFTTKQQEQFARGFEAWLRTGQTQVTGLKGVFRRFKQMLTSLYKTFKELGGKPPKNVAEVMERMVATTAEAQEAAKDRKLKSEFWEKQVKRAYPGISKEAREEMVDTLLYMQDGYGKGTETSLVYDQVGNNVVERVTSSNNDPWYQEFYANNHKKPSIAEQIDIAHAMIFGDGYGSELDEAGKKAAQNFFDKGGRLEYDGEGSAEWIPRSQVEDSVVSPKDVDDYLSAVAEQGEQAKRPEKVVKVPQRQLPVQTKDKTAKERLSKFEARVLGVGDKLDKMSQEEIDELGLQTYKQSSNKEQLEKAARMVAKDPDNVFSILSGEKPLPKDMLYGSLYIAYQEYANQEGEEGNYQAALAAASLQATRAGQEIQILSNIDKNSPVSIINRIYQTRIEALGERMGRTKNSTEARRIAKQEINKQTNEKMAEFNSEMKKNTKEDNNNLEKLLAEVIC